jgi:hypothetical protein
LIRVPRLFIRIALPLRIDPLRVRFAIENEEAVFGDKRFAGFDGPVVVLGGGDAEVRIFGFEAEGLGEVEVGG